MKKRLLILVVVCVAALFSLIAFVIFGKQKKFEFQRIVKQPSLERFSKDFTAEINTAKIFAERYVRSYLDFLEREIDEDFRSSFMLESKKSISCKVFFSSVAESLIYLYPADECEMTVECAQYPIQLCVLGGLDTSAESIWLITHREEVLLSYEEMGTAIAFGKGCHYIGNFILRTNTLKFFSFSKNSLVALCNVSFVVEDKDKDIREVTIEHVGLLTGERDFSFALEKAYELGREQAENETILLFVSSTSFRELLAYEKLKPFAEEIQDKVSRNDKDPSFVYPFLSFDKDVVNLRKKAAEMGLDTDFVDNLLKDVGPYDGYLFWYYSNYTGYMLQWTLANVALLILIIALLILGRRGLLVEWKLVKLMNKKGVKLLVVFSVNGYILSKIPESTHIKYMLIPGLLFLACLGLSLYIPSKNNRLPK